MVVSEKVKQFVKKYVYLADESGNFAEFYRKANQFLTPEEIGSMGTLMTGKETLSTASCGIPFSSGKSVAVFESILADTR